MVIAEKVKRDIKGQEQGQRLQGHEETRISTDEMDKDVADKKYDAGYL